jgi:transposase
MAERRKRRTWSDDEKRLICGQARLPGVSVSQVARRYDVNANLVFKWLRDRRFAEGAPEEERACFLPVEVGGVAEVRPAAPTAESRIEIEVAGGHRIRFSGGYDPDALARLIRGLTA